MELGEAMIESGQAVWIRDVLGDVHPRRAVSGVRVRGHDFPVVLVCREEEWEAAVAAEREPDAVGWPAEDVLLTPIESGNGSHS